MIKDVFGRPIPRFSFKKSAAVSPTVVARILITQNARVTSGTLDRELRTWFTEHWESIAIVSFDTEPSTLLTIQIHQGLIPQEEHLTKRYAQWVARQEVKVGWCPEVA
jgi:hypothetical protein